MRVTFYKSLDREFELMGVKGRWIQLVLIGSGAALVLAFLVGSIVGTGVGIVVFIAAVAVICFGAISFQVKLPSRQIDKAVISSKVPGWIIRRESLSRILLEDKGYVEMKRREKEDKESAAAVPVEDKQSN